KDPAPKVTDFNAQDYATLFSHPSPFWKFPEEFLCLVRLSRHYTLDEDTYPSFLNKDGEDMDIFAFIHTLDPTKSELEASVDKLFDEGGSGIQAKHGDSTGGEGGPVLIFSQLLKPWTLLLRMWFRCSQDVKRKGKP
nr:transposase (putative), gypsy type [Tanacetum cinerariifolium]